MYSQELGTVSGVKYKFYVGEEQEPKTITGSSDNTFTFEQQWTNVFCYGHEVKDLSRAKFVSANDYSSLYNEKFDLCIGSHSLSELAWDDFISYYETIVKNSKYFFYAGHNWHGGRDLLKRKLDLINQDFDLVKQCDEDFIDSYDNNGLYNNLYLRK